MTYAKYLEIEKEDHPLVAITVSFDAGWQKRNSGNKYDSPSGHGFQVGALCRKIVAKKVLSKLCSGCGMVHASGDAAPAHKCVKNYSGSSNGWKQTCC